MMKTFTSYHRATPRERLAIVPAMVRPASVSPAGGVRITDVARQAGVSIATVSRALNEPDKVVAATRERVTAAVRALGYVPNLTAGSLASSRSRLIGAVVPVLSNVWFAQTLDSLAQGLATQGYQLLLAQSGYEAREEARVVETFLARRVDALVLTGGTHAPGLASRLARAGLPVVELWDLPRRPIDQAIGFSNEAVGVAVAEHLLARGRRRPAFVGAREQRSLRRLDGLRRAFEAHGVHELSEELVPPNADLSVGTAAMQALLDRRPDVDAVFCSNDVLAAGALKAAQARALAVPGQLSVVGFSDMPIARACSPELSTVRISPPLLGRRAADRLLERLAGQPATGSRREDVGFELIPRGSS